MSDNEEKARQFLEELKRKYDAKMETASHVKGIGFAMMEITAPRNALEMMKVAGKHEIWIMATAKNYKELSKKLRPLTTKKIDEELKHIFLVQENKHETEKMKVDSDYVVIHPAHKIVYICADSTPIAFIEFIQLPNNEVTVNVNCRKEQVLTSYKKHFK